MCALCAPPPFPEPGAARLPVDSEGESSTLRLGLKMVPACSREDRPERLQGPRAHPTPRTPAGAPEGAAWGGLPAPRRRRGECPGSSCTAPCPGLGWGSAAGGCSGLGRRVRGGCLPLSGWGPEQGGGGGGSSQDPALDACLTGTTLAAGDANPTRTPSPEGRVCEARRWDGNEAAPTSFQLGLGVEP
ncbi:potassium/sodium hyperpolarization-activated cyclic nucleotide-gated channel 4-like isoform X1 [Alexandromys fortis]|uniref:potassium/sodium hyperpolarization-activated cyclic nucleotide-gated channel 4-like isoform X1 n=1 Tax=Alexandromys fortis TaxID=100897 RepID=UPI0021537D08|nr:potassium/sodium hyperpolarization-activated cyclic nucleotide-gated channel 4-like isoform X1 [Microtus fortis]